MPNQVINHQNIYYETLGEGDPVLLLHGWTEIGRDMRAVAEPIAAMGYQVIMPDRPGYGQSNPPYRYYSPDFYHRDAIAMCDLLDTLGVKNAHIMGFSDGGEVTLLIATARPDLCRTAVAWGAIGAYPPELCEYVRRGLPPTWITNEIRAKHPGQDVDLWPYQWVDAFCAIIAEGGDVSLSHANRITSPLLLMLGDQDRLNPVSAGQTFVDAVPKNAELSVFPGVGHAIHEEQPEAFLFAVKSFWKQFAN